MPEITAHILSLRYILYELLDKEVALMTPNIINP